MNVSPTRLTLLAAASLVPATAWAAPAQPARPPKPAERIPKTEMGVTQLSNENMNWMLDAKFGMFVHWGLYSGPGRGEWVMENEGILPEKYREYGELKGGSEYFDAKDFHPDQWAKLAREAGMKWICLTARHHDGFSLFDSPHPNAFTSQQTLGRDLIAEYVKAVRSEGLKVGIYYSPLNWRYPGYYDVTGKDMKPNKFGYKQSPSNKENARLMKEENYVNVRKLLTGYGKIDTIFWDGGWLGQKGSDASAAFFHEPGKYLDMKNEWPISAKYQDLEAGTGKPLGIMGMVRKYQPDAVTNLRFGWIGDITEEEGARETKGRIRDSVYQDKCMCIQSGPWGYNPASLSKTMSLDKLVGYLANAAVRNMTFLLNVTPDRHGVIPDVQQQRLREMGGWLAKTGDAIYGTRGGPWQPVDSKYGYTYKDSTVFVHLLKGYDGSTFKMPPLGRIRVKKVYDVFTGKELKFDGESAGTVSGIDRKSSPADTIVAVVYQAPVARVWD